MLQKATWPDKQSDYFVKTNDALDANGSRPVYKRDEETGAPMLTHERAKKDEHGSWKIVSDTNTAPPARGPALPPAAKIDAGDLGELNEKGLFPDGKGNEFARIGKEHHQVKYDQQLGGFRAVDPDKPNAFHGSVPVKLDGKGGM